MISFFPEAVTSLLYETAARGKQRDNCDIIFHKAKNNPIFLADRPLEPVGCLTDEIAIKRKKIETSVISVFSNQNTINNPLRFKLFFLIFELIYILIV